MKRAGNCFNQICLPDNFRLAYYKACKGKRATDSVLQFSQNFDSNLEKIRYDFENFNFNFGNYTYFKIFDPKERLICAASFHERIVHHAIMNVCHEIFERQFIFRTYATRPKKGTFAALDQAKKYANRFVWYAKLDIRKYFDSIDHEILMFQLKNIFKDKKVLYVFEQIIRSYNQSEGKGLPIGNLTSQYFANFHLAAADRYAVETLKLKYIRYMDDMIFFSNNKIDLQHKITEFVRYVTENLQLEFKIKIQNKIAAGLPFLGFRIFKHTVRLNKNSKLRFKRKIKLYYNRLNTKTWNQNQFTEHVLPLMAFIKHADSFEFRKKIIFAYEG